MKVKFLPKGIELEIEPNQTVMDLAHKNGIFIKSVCNGVPNCAECRVKLVDGEYNVLPPSSKELTLIGSGHFIDQRRLSCQLYCFGDITVDLSEQEKKENEGPPGSRRFQLELRNEGVVSKAVTGNLIQQDSDIIQALTEKNLPEKSERTRRDRGVVHSNKNTKHSRPSLDSNAGPKSKVVSPPPSKARVEALIQEQSTEKMRETKKVK